MQWEAKERNPEEEGKSEWKSSTDNLPWILWLPDDFDDVCDLGKRQHQLVDV